MLLKYLNELEVAVQALADHPDSDTLTRCTHCVATLDAYLDEQMEPVKQRGRELMDGLMPPELLERVGHSVH
ncbi:MAG: hypothetical protein VX258_13135 [Pseudomonadota bacterium]|uniref:hypothetical protein n=1 Tax=Alcanivorax sp. TaxID=1872427 RepID=UPI00243DF948|nr:hypothetical protein [Alcanivorax sp.]MEE3321629.1 hypothetical protein [Pseudomonadota bacterium]